MTARDDAPARSAGGVGRPRDGAGRRDFLKSALGVMIAPMAGAALGGAFGGAFGAGGGTGGSAALAATPPLPGPGLAARRHGGYFLVEGWVLTEADLDALGIAVPPSAAAGLLGGLASPGSKGARVHDL